MALHPRLERKIKEFLPTYRLGVDLGEAAGGLALIHNNNILHAETFTDFHEATLETKRALRRGRRTRHAKKMRLARLRSWILRQCIPAHVTGAEIKDSYSRLPDPYRLMKDKKYQTLPGFYEVKGQNPEKSPTWIDKAKAGEVDAEGFVIALTHILQKRGYKYDGKEFSDYDDSRLIDFIDSCAMLAEAPEMRKALEDEIMRREVGEKEKPKLHEAFDNALNRQRERKKALPRQVREKDMEDMVDVFGRRWQLSQEIIANWKSQLTGLLNKVVREARYDNRLKSGCSWCGKKTPRLAKPEIRELAFEAAVGNLRIRERDGRDRPISDEERNPLRGWFQRRRENHDYSRATKNTPIEERAPSEDNIRTYLEQIGVKKAWIRKKKGKEKWKFDFAMLPQLDNLINKEARKGRARLCVEHMRMQAEGKTMKDADVDWQSMRKRNAPNPRREQHDARVLKRIERLIFNRGKKGTDAWRHGPIAVITLEVPMPVDLERAREKEQVERKPLNLRQRLHAETEGVCIYCGENVHDRTMHLEHIVPQAKGGPDVQMNRIASCPKCNADRDTGKKDMLPSEWLTGDKWNVFKSRVMSLNLPPLKKQLLLLEPGSKYPNDPTPLARVSARWRAFAADIMWLFDEYSVPVPTLNYEKDKPHIQVVRGNLTSRLRRDWRWKDHEATVENFPDKRRTDLYNHAQDAAILAAIPPHTWQEQIFSDMAVRPCAKKDEQGNILKNEKEMRPRPGIAALALAPEWADYERTQKELKRPMVHTLGKLKATWRRQIMDLSFYQNPTDNDGPLFIRKVDAKTGKRETKEVQKGGLVVQVPHYDGTSGKRKVQIKPIQSNAIILWHDPSGRKDNLNISIERPAAIKKFVKHPVDPPIASDAIILGRIERASTLWLREGKGTVELKADKKSVRSSVVMPEGIYRVKELGSNGVIVVQENAVSKELANKLGISDDQFSKVPERALGKKELAEYFKGNQRSG
ncbi:MAG: hypothetical protein A3K22_06405 [Deltaproteobacteria bacterium RBG_16_42_7]|nr:MAG: hypothetical protein A3K22_06405 [Deltaproteobacteria bacterium RBG_16_42_7]